jgi:hypothetical protein
MERKLTGDEKRWGELLLVAGRCHSRDPRWTAEEGVAMVNPGQNNFTTTRISYTRGIAEWWVEWWLTGGEGAVATSLSGGETYEERGNFSQPVTFIRGGERGGVVPHVGDRTLTSSRTGGARCAPGSPALSH